MPRSKPSAKWARRCEAKACLASRTNRRRSIFARARRWRWRGFCHGCRDRRRSGGLYLREAGGCNRNAIEPPSPCRPFIDQIEGNRRWPQSEKSAQLYDRGAEHPRRHGKGRRQEQGVRKVNPALPEAGENLCERRGIVSHLEARCRKITQDRIVARKIGMMHRRHCAPDQLVQLQAVGNRNRRWRGHCSGRKRCTLGNLRESRRCRMKKQAKNCTDVTKGRGRKPRPPVRPQPTNSYHANWNPPRAPTSPELRPTPTPAEITALSLTRAEKAVVAADRC